MSGREAFVPPTSSAALSAAAAGVNSHKASGTQYLCANCARHVLLSKGEPVRCKECGHRVLYKERTRRVIQFEAR